MSYTVLARKWRPHGFQELVGQEHVVRALSNALTQQRLHHAYLFTGTRGVGKTTLARILAKCLNCNEGITAAPCGRCDACQEIDQGRFMDLIEVDAASRTKVDDTRSLLDNAQYAPGKGRFKIYLIDEVHMLSTHSFNALLKTLEEPPEHVKFLLATTDPQKLPVTVLSRCLQFNLHRLGADRIAAHLAHILESEGIASDPPALRALARAADGSVRDALSLLDQAIAYAGGRLTTGDVDAMLGTVNRLQVDDLLAALAAGDADAVWQVLTAWRQRSPDYSGLLDALALRLQAIAFQQTFGHLTEDEEPIETSLLDALSPAALQVYYQICLLGKRDLYLAPDPASGFEMVVLRLHAFRPQSPRGTESLAAPDRVSAGPAPETGKPRAVRAATLSTTPPQAEPPVSRPAHEEEAIIQAVTATPTADGFSASKPLVAAPLAAVPERPAGGSEVRDDWDDLVSRLGLRGGPFELARHCALKSRDDGRMVLELPRQQHSLRRPAAEQSLLRALREYLRQPELVLRIEEIEQTAQPTPAQRQDEDRVRIQDQAEAAIREDGVVQLMQARLDARLQSVRPLGAATLNDGE
ncbi:MAG: DNA polymerase III subunit gamma/tau [Candidatus Macondimonas sp.]